MAKLQIHTPAPDKVRLSVLGAHTQVDISLPLDVPIARLAPALVHLVATPESTPLEAADDRVIGYDQHNVWALSRSDGETPLRSTTTLREATVVDGELLRLTAERALSVPTLYDDGVDAAARLNRASHAGWDATAARWMMVAGVYLATAVWVYFLVSDTLAPNRAAFVGLSTAAATVVVGVAVIAHRRFGLSDVGAALGWAVLPIAGAVAWAELSPLGGYGLAAGCAAMAMVGVAVFYATRTGYWGHLASGVFFAVCGCALVAHAVGVSADVVGAALAVIATLGALAVPRLTERLIRFDPPPQLRDHDGGTVATSASSLTTATTPNHDVSPPAAESIWVRARVASATRAGLYAGLAVSAGIGASVVVRSPDSVRCSSLVFGLTCVAALGSCAQRLLAVQERAALGIPAVALMVWLCVRAQDGSQLTRLAALGVLVAAAVSLAVIGVNATGRTNRGTLTLLAYVFYLTTAALIPLALWQLGVYEHLGIK